MMSDYDPRPIPIDHIKIPESIYPLVERLAENAHDVWARRRLQDGWVCGAERSDQGRQHPCLVPYSELPESEKDYDREVVIGTIKAMLALGCTITPERPT